MEKNHKNSLTNRKSVGLSCLLVLLLLLDVILKNTHACSTVLLKRDKVLLIGHNLDESVDFEGFVCVNKRDVYKVGSSVLYQIWVEIKEAESGEVLAGRLGFPPAKVELGWSIIHRNIVR